MKSNVFKKELELIVNENIKEWTKDMLELLPDYFWEVPASSTGKYHPKHSLGEGGLVRHTISAVRIANELFGCESFIKDEDGSKKDIVISALLLHDGCKSGIIKEKYTRADHPLLAVKLLKDNYKGQIPEDIFNSICNAISSHMGQWNTDYKTKKEILPKPNTNLGHIVHIADYLSSRPIILMDWDRI